MCPEKPHTSVNETSSLLRIRSLFIESLLQLICSKYESSPKRQNRIFSKLCENLLKLNLIDDTYKCSEFDSIRLNYMRSVDNFIKIVQLTNADVNNIDGIEKFISSWYSEKYDEIELIGSGGYGSVYKARNKLDRTFYAIKKIPLEFTKSVFVMRSLQEVYALAKLNHPNIVNYKTAWIEPYFEIDNTVNDLKGSQQLSDFSPRSVTNNSSFVVNFEELSSKVSRYSSDDRNEFEYDKGEGNEPVELYSDIAQLNGPPDVSSKEGQSSDSCITDVNSLSKKRNVKYSAFLYIQMQLCDQTLADWVDENKKLSRFLDIKKSITIFKKVVKGVHYLHSKGIIHHDIKPQNIFLSKNEELVQIGDFGLSSVVGLPNMNNDFVLNSFKDCKMNIKIGTTHFAAPEQSPLIVHTVKSDIYSLGVLLLDLVNPYFTNSERIESLFLIKKGVLPDIMYNYSTIVPLIYKMIDDNYEMRPDASEVLEAIRWLDLDELQQINEKLKKDKTDK